ncbi:MAG: tRNA uridine-5-carboxymethylaminomethyl(34) synthesis GTPase MnmE [Pseudomonadota bacterium]
MRTDPDDTIFALATGAGKGAIAIIRISGPNTDALLKRIIGGNSLPDARQAALHILYDHSHQPIDQAMIIRFRAPKSYTGEDMAEIHCHGGVLVSAAILGTLQGHGLARIAEPGEFTKRAYYNQKIHLTQAESINDLITANTARQHQQAMQQMRGIVHDALEDLAKEMRHTLAHFEASIDFADEELPDDLAKRAMDEISAYHEKLQTLIASSQGAIRLREGLRVAIIGATNVGKSTLINMLSAREVAIVTDHAGTTRDALEVALDIDGYPVTLIDTAGMRDTDDAVEKIGIVRAKQTSKQADFRIVLCACDVLQSWEIARDCYQDGDIIVMNRCDIVQPQSPLPGAHVISLKTMHGVPDARAAITAKIRAICGDSEGIAVTRQRHLDALMEACHHCGVIIKDAERDAEFLCEDLRRSLHALGRVTGMVDVEDLLDIIFHDFCLGK